MLGMNENRITDIVRKDRNKLIFAIFAIFAFFAFVDCTNSDVIKGF